jgi:hypothetical protein
LLPADSWPKTKILKTKNKEFSDRSCRRFVPDHSVRLSHQLVDAIEIKSGFVGVQALLGKDGPSRFAEKPDEKGILHEVLQPGLCTSTQKNSRY